MTLRRMALLVCGFVAAAIVSGPAGAATPFTAWAVRGYDTTLKNVTFLDQSTGFAVGDRGTIMRTTDGGHTWSLQSSGVGTLLNDVRFASDAVGYVVGSYGKILKTTDGGATWTPQAWQGQSPDIHLRGVDFASPGHGVAVGIAGIALHTVVGRGGAEIWLWGSTPDGYALNAVDMLDDNVVYAVGNKGTIDWSGDGGASWQSVSYRWPPGVIRPDLYDVSFKDATTGWAVGADGTIFQISGANKTATTVQSPTTNDLYGVRALGGTAIAVGANGTVLEYLNGTWQLVDEHVTDDLHGVSFGMSQPIAAVGNHGLVLGSETLGLDMNWNMHVQPSYGDRTLRALDLYNGLPVYVGDDATAVAVNAPHTWSTTSGGDIYEDGDFVFATGTPLHGIAYPGTVGLVVGESAILRSFNGSTWAPAPGAPSGKSYRAVQIVNDGTNAAAWVVGDHGTVVESTDYYQAQSSFQNAGPNTTKDLVALSFVTPGFGYVGASDGTIFLATGGSWQQAGTVPSQLTGLSFPTFGTGWASGYGIYKTENAGFTWTADTPPAPVNAIRVVAGSGWAVGDHGLVLQHVQ